MPSSDRLEFRTIIKFCHDFGQTPSQTLKLIEKTKRDKPVSRALVLKLHRRFSEGQGSFEEREGRGRKKRYCVSTVTAIRDALDVDRRLTVRELAERFNIGYGTVHRILMEKLHMSKVILSYIF